MVPPVLKSACAVLLGFNGALIHISVMERATTTSVLPQVC